MGIQEKSWVDLGEGEEVLWWNHPHLLHYSIEILMGFAMAIGGIVLLFVDVGYAELSWYPILLSVFGLLYIVFQLYRRSFHYYVITTNKLIERRGIIFEERNPIHFNRIAKTRLTRTVGEKIISFHPNIDIADILIKTAGTDGTEMVLYDLPKANKVAKLIEERMVGGDNMSGGTHTKFGNANNQNNHPDRRQQKGQHRNNQHQYEQNTQRHRQGGNQHYDSKNTRRQQGGHPPQGRQQNRRPQNNDDIEPGEFR